MITKNHETTETLRQTQERLAFLINNSPTVIYTCLTEPPYALSFISANVKINLGYSTEDFTSDSNFWSSHLHPDDAPKVFIELSRIQTAGQHSHEYRFRRPNGSYCWLHDKLKLVKDTDGKLIEIIGSWTDITERKQAEQALKNSEQQLSAIYSNVKGVLFNIDVEPTGLFRFSSINQAFLDATGLKQEQVIGHLVQDIIPEPSLTQVLEHYHRAILTKETVRWEEESTYPSGKKYGLVAITPVLDEKGKVLRLVGIVHDITERVKSEKALIESKNLVEAIVKNAPLMIFVKDAKDLKFVEFNKAGESLLGVSRSELIGKSDLDFFPAEQAAFYIATDRKVLSSEHVVDVPEEIIQTKKKGQRFLHTLKVTIREADGAPKYLLGISEDITERKKLTDELYAAKQAAEEASLAKSAFLANMSHEIRTPLGAILGFSELIIDPHVTKSEKTEFISVIKRNGELLSNIINDILDLSKVEAGKVKINLNETSMSEILTDIRAILELKAREKGIDLIIITDENVPERINTDALRLRQILNNIIGNAIKFTTKGSVEVKIHYTAGPTGQNQLSFVVKDTGLGISADQIGKLFAPFSQADDTSKRKFGGTGLGLNLSRHLAKLLGGDVVLTQTSLGEGSTFTVSIDPGPLSNQLLKEIEKKSLVSNQKKKLKLNDIKVLLVEDDTYNQILINQILKLEGASVDIASNGQEGVTKAMKDPHQVVLMDIQMPVMDGFEATAQLRKNGYKGKIIALTAHALSEDKERCLHSGFDDYLSKPIDRKFLIERVKHFSTQ